MKLGKRERCPIHRSLTCCGRQQIAKKSRRPNKTIGPGVTLLEDGRIRRSRSAMKRLLVQKIRHQDGKCHWCKEQLDDFRGVEADHINPRGMNGARRDDHEDNICAACVECNAKKGSRRLEPGEKP